MKYDCRPIVSPADWDQAANFRNSFWPSYPLTGEQIRLHASYVPPEHPVDRWIVTQDSEPIAYVVITPGFWYKTPGRFEARIFLLEGPDQECHISDLLELIWDRVVERGGNVLGIWVQDDKKVFVSVLEGAGMVPTQRNPDSSLNLETFDPEPFLLQWPTLEAQGYRVMTLKELSELDPDWQRKAYDLEMAIMRDVPLPDPWIDTPFASYVKELNSPYMRRESIFYMDYNGTWVGTSALHPNFVNPRLFNTGLTGVVAAHRRKGVARVLKARALEFAKSLGGVRVSTDNEESNPMFQLNLELGFKKDFDWVCYERRVIGP